MAVNSGRTPFQWLSALQQAKSDQSPFKLTVADIVDRCNDPNATSSLEPTSPRSVEACLRLGLEPYELKFIAQHHFLKNLRDKDLADLAFKHHEDTRQERLAALVEERKRILEGHYDVKAKERPVGAAVKGFDATDIVEKEQKRLEVVRRRQERELTQMLQYEMTRQELQEKAEAKVRKVQDRAEAERKAKAEKTKQWHKQQHEREQARISEDAKREKAAEAAELARYEKEMEAAARLTAAEKERKAVARQKEMERVEKVAKSRRETERLLAKQQAEIDRKKAEMIAKDKEREKVKAQQQIEAAERNAEARTKAEARITAALAANATILAKRRTDFDAKEKAAQSRRGLHEAARQAEEATAKQEELTRQEQRKKAYTEAQRREGDRVAAILEKQRVKGQALQSLGERREHESDLKSLKHQLDLENKRDKVEAMKRRELYQRMALLEKISESTEKAKSLVEQRSRLQEQRRSANMEASFQRQRLQESVSRMQAKKDFRSMNVADVLTKSATQAH